MAALKSNLTKPVGLRPSERYNVLAAAKKTAVTQESARAEEEDAWREVRDSESRGSGDSKGDHECKPCGEEVTTKPAEEAPIRIAKDPGDPTEEEFENHCDTLTVQTVVSNLRQRERQRGRSQRNRREHQTNSGVGLRIVRSGNSDRR